MIVIAIIGILAAALFPSLTGYLKRSRDAARTSNMKDIATAMWAYYADAEKYPLFSNGCANQGAGFTGTNYFPKGLPTDPQSSNNNGCPTNGQYAAGSTGQTSGVPAFAVVSLLENANGWNYSGAVASLTGVISIDTATILGRMGTANKGVTNIYVLTN